MAIKLYEYDANTYKAATDFKYPNKMQAGLFIHWWQTGYVSMDTDLAALLNPLNENAFTKSDADGVAAVKAASKSYYNGLCGAKIAEAYTIGDELQAHRTNDTATLTDIGNRVAGVLAERDALLDVGD